MQARTNKEIEECISNCQECHSICLQTISHCLEKGGEHAEQGHISLLLDCAEICQTSANFMLRQSEFHGETCRTCARLCEECARSCEEFGDDEVMQRCAEICRECADSCHRMETQAAA